MSYKKLKSKLRIFLFIFPMAAYSQEQFDCYKLIDEELVKQSECPWTIQPINDSIDRYQLSNNNSKQVFELFICGNSIFLTKSLSFGSENFDVSLDTIEIFNSSQKKITFESDGNPFGFKSVNVSNETDSVFTVNFYPLFSDGQSHFYKCIIGKNFKINQLKYYLASENEYYSFIKRH